MWVSTLEINNIKSFAASGTIKLSKNINILIGANNSGKSILIKALFMLQEINALQVTDLRIGSNEGTLVLNLNEIPDGQAFNNIDMTKLESIPNGKVEIKIQAPRPTVNVPPKHYTLSIGDKSLSMNGIGLVNSTEPNNFIYPFLSKRKVISYGEMINKTNATMVSGNLGNIVSKIDRVSNPQHPAYETYKSACESVLGFFVSTFLSANGKQAGIVVSNYENIPLEAMGEGVANLVGIIVDLCMADNKLFIIEELENDIHPKSLKKLLELIIQKSETNQFVISTHSNIITKYLGAVQDSKVFQITMPNYTSENRMPASTCKEAAKPNERRAILEVLGYELEDFDLARGWLFFEESSAERIIKEFLIPWFTPRLRGRIRTVAALGTSDVEPRFKDFNRLFVFLHLEEAYKNHAWVMVDGEQSGQDVVTKLKALYVPNGWAEDHFITFSQNDFEYYYPEAFQADVATALGSNNKDKKREAKKQLIEKILAWAISDEQKAKAEFEKSAHEVINILQTIENVLFPL